MKSEFEKLNEIYTSITDIDRILKTTDDRDKLDNVFNAIKNINRSELDQQIINNVIGSIRNALVKVYQETLIEINKNITPEPVTRVSSITEAEKAATVNVRDYCPSPILEETIAQSIKSLSFEDKLKAGKNIADLIDRPMHKRGV